MTPYHLLLSRAILAGLDSRPVQLEIGHSRSRRRFEGVGCCGHIGRVGNGVHGCISRVLYRTWKGAWGRYLRCTEDPSSRRADVNIQIYRAHRQPGFAVEIEYYAVLREVVCKSNWDCNKNLSLKQAVSSLGKHKPACPRGILRGWIQTDLMDRIEDRVVGMLLSSYQPYCSICGRSATLGSIFAGLLVPNPNCLSNINLIGFNSNSPGTARHRSRDIQRFISPSRFVTNSPEGPPSQR
ncbi:predicted protein [Histoplasma capsulatum H143]|uniref:Uncharacterized protein n=1 Tax=Ajellomyces capsulatus (strain H143) TaxID=544712 RepID=C6H8J0_AJECH|nr:predicted protein [Histoplasma capsulatum H143]